MDNIEEKYLPIGTVIEVDNSDLRLIIVGYGAKDSETGERFDYIGYPFPNGFVSVKATALFNKDRIGKILCNGYKDESYNKMLETAKKLEEQRSKEC